MKPNWKKFKKIGTCALISGINKYPADTMEITYGIRLIGKFGTGESISADRVEIRRCPKTGDFVMIARGKDGKSLVSDSVELKAQV